MQNTKMPSHDDEAHGIGAASGGSRSALQNNSDFAEMIAHVHLPDVRV
jgi:hypothetical protein